MEEDGNFWKRISKKFDCLFTGTFSKRIDRSFYVLVDIICHQYFEDFSVHDPTQFKDCWVVTELSQRIITFSA